jgi:hypothetical protein
MFLYYFNVSVLKIIFKKIILMYFQVKNIFIHKWYYNFKHRLLMESHYEKKNLVKLLDWYLFIDGWINMRKKKNIANIIFLKNARGYENLNRIILNILSKIL